jgi:hypothetical protein
MSRVGDERESLYFTFTCMYLFTKGVKHPYL